MELGLNLEAMQSLFKKEYNAELDNKFTPIKQASLEDHYKLLKGINEPTAVSLADMAVRMMANSEALLKVIHENNLLLASHLNQK